MQERKARQVSRSIDGSPAETWLAGARLTEIAHLVMLAKVELASRGITLTWSISQN